MDDNLRQIFLYLHPLTLHECKRVCKDWLRLIVDPQTARWFFIERYHQLPPSEITFWQQYYPLPGAERYRSLQECFADALRNKDKSSVDYFRGISSNSLEAKDYIFELKKGPRISRKELEYARTFVFYSSYMNNFGKYGLLIGSYGDQEFYDEEFIKIPSCKKRSFSIGFMRGLVTTNHPRLPEILECNPYLKRLLEENNIMENPDEEITTSPRSWLSRHKEGRCFVKVSRRYKIYQDLLLRGDWEIYDDFVTIFYPQVWRYRDRKTGSISEYPSRFDDIPVLLGKRPPQRLLYGVIHQLIRQDHLKRLYEILVRLDQLHVGDRNLFYRHCLNSAIIHGKRDLVNYFLPYVQRRYS